MDRVKVKGELVKFQNSRGYHHDGILYESVKSRKTIIHIHGSYGNFYQAYFPHVFAKKYTENGFNFLSFNLTSHDGFSEGYINENGFDYVGGAVSDFSNCLSDIEGAIDFAKEFSDRIILQGHSLGCDRTVEYLLKSNQNYDFILLAPCDSYRLQEKWLSPEETVENQIERLKKGYSDIRDYDWLPAKEYGVYSQNEEYILPITRKALLSIMTGAPFKLFNIQKPIDYFINQNSFIYLGGNDSLQTDKSEIMFKFLKDRIKAIEPCFIVKGDHMMKNCEEEVALKILNWLNSLKY
jgi:hypothetical protein